jgi:hypothetical protein
MLLFFDLVCHEAEVDSIAVFQRNLEIKTVMTAAGRPEPDDLAISQPNCRRWGFAAPDPTFLTGSSRPVAALQHEPKRTFKA